MVNVEIEPRRFIKQMQKQQNKPTKITLTTGNIIFCTPLQPLEEDYESYLVEMLKPSPQYGNAGSLSEVCGKDIKSIDPI